MLPPPGGPSPLLVVLHGMGLGGPAMAAWTGLAQRGNEAGFATVFPDALDEVWDDVGAGRLDGADDAAFIVALVDQLVAEGVAGEGDVFLVGFSNGANFAERLARHGLVSTAGLVLVAGTAREPSRQGTERPAQAAAVLMFEGTGDPLLPYRGGNGRGPLAWMARRGRRRVLLDPGRGAVGAETVAADWAAVNGLSAEATKEVLGRDRGDLAVDRLSWTAQGRPPVVLYRIAGGGHGWPNGPQYMPSFLIGRVAQHLDATGILLDFLKPAAP
jgi:polyhydroxybutyrate depolymerase